MLTKTAFKIRVKTVILWNIIAFKITVFYLNIFQNVIYSCDAKLNFQHYYSSLQCHMILHKSFLCADVLLVIISVENSFTYFCENYDTRFFDEQR